MYFPFKVFAFTAGLALATAAHAETSALDPEHFLDPQQEETSALIAQDLASSGIGSAASLEAFSQATGLALRESASAPTEDTLVAIEETAPAPAEDTVVAREEAAPAPAADTLIAIEETAPAPAEDTVVAIEEAAPPAPVAVEETAAALERPVPDRAVQDPETTVSATEVGILPSQTETTGSVVADVAAPTLAIVAVDANDAAVAGERAPDETFRAVDPTHDLADTLLP